MEKSAHNKGCGYDAKQYRSKYFLPPVQKEDGVLLADALAIVWVLQESDCDLCAPFIPLSLVIWQIVTIV